MFNNQKKESISEPQNYINVVNDMIHQGYSKQYVDGYKHFFEEEYGGPIDWDGNHTAEKASEQKDDNTDKKKENNVIISSSKTAEKKVDKKDAVVKTEALVTEKKEVKEAPKPKEAKVEEKKKEEKVETPVVLFENLIRDSSNQIIDLKSLSFNSEEEKNFIMSRIIEVHNTYQTKEYAKDHPAMVQDFNNLSLVRYFNEGDFIVKNMTNGVMYHIPPTKGQITRSSVDATLLQAHQKFISNREKNSKEKAQKKAS